jgi:hypothetical protein
MDGNKQSLQPVRRSDDVILFQRISGGWEYRYTRDCETYRGFANNPILARDRLLNQLGWELRRFDSADFRRF